MHAYCTPYEYTRYCKGWVRPLLHHAARLAGGYGEGRGKKEKGSMLSVRTMVALNARTRFVPPALHVAEAEQQIYRVWPSMDDR